MTTLPEAKPLSKEDADSFFAANTPESLRKKYEDIDKIMVSHDRLMKYCMENRCGFDDLIEAHKKIKKDS